MLRATPAKFSEVMGNEREPGSLFMGAAVGAIFGKNLPKKGKKVSNTSMLEIDKS